MSINPTKRFSWRLAILVFLGAGLLAGGILLFTQTRTLSVQSSPVVVHVMAAEAPDQPPVRLIIPAIGVDAAVQSVGLSTKGDGAMGIPDNFTDVAWYNKGPLPGMAGSAVIDGHLDGKGVPKAVFYDLGRLVAGDVVEVVDQAGKILKFHVVLTKTYEYNASAAEVFVGDTSKARLNLITCGGDWMKDKKLYDKRIVVFTELAAAE